MFRTALFILTLMVLSGINQKAFSAIPELSEYARISVITCGPGEDLYATFGHSAFRIWDPVNDVDWVYNYGTFDFNTSNFYFKFARGKLLYALSKDYFENFMFTYQLENRWVKEQVLNLNSEQKVALFEFLENNLKPENRFYQYDFLFENCATKIPEVLGLVLGDSLVFDSQHIKEPKSFRQLIEDNLNTNSWSSFGINLALGSVIDRNALPLEFTFLPQYVWQQLEHSNIGKTPVVVNSRTLLNLPESRKQGFWLFSPLFIFSFLLLLIVVKTITDLKRNTPVGFLDYSIWAITGLTGLVVVFLWFFTDHKSTAQNANILWAMPLNLILVFTGIKLKTSMRYLVFVLGLLLLCPIVWILGYQEFSPVLLPIWGGLAMRYAYLIRYYRKLP